MNNSYNSDPRNTASVYRCKDITEQLVKDDEWFDYEIKVVGKTVTLSLNGKVVNEWTEPANGAASVDPGWRFNEGTFALQGHDPGRPSTIASAQSGSRTDPPASGRALCPATASTFGSETT